MAVCWPGLGWWWANTAKRAVARLYQSTIREVFRLQQPALDGGILSCARERFDRAQGHEARKALAGLFAKLARCRILIAPVVRFTS